jgi:hypothetical protein
MENTKMWNREAANKQLCVRWTERQINELRWLHHDDDDDDDNDEHGDGDYTSSYRSYDDEIDSSNMIEPSHFFRRTKQLHSELKMSTLL